MVLLIRVLRRVFTMELPLPRYTVNHDGTKCAHLPPVCPFVILKITISMNNLLLILCAKFIHIVLDNLLMIVFSINIHSL
jgi:hypothetical protein